jgi:eukaryotic-like serine/threonine-protein kinase
MEPQIPSRGAVVDLAKRNATPPRLSPAGFGDTRDHDLVQSRIARTYGLFALLLAGFWVLGTIPMAVLAPAQAVDLDASKAMYLACIVVLAVAWRICRRATLPWVVIGIIDVVSLLSLSALLAVWAVYAPAGLHLEQLGVTLFALFVMLRAALVPAPPRWTAAVSAVAAVPLTISSYALMRNGRGMAEPFPGVIGVIMVATLGAMVTIAAWQISRVVYGLRVQIKSAMRLGQYTLEEKIGEGGMGVVYRARHAMLRRPTAVKLLSASATDTVSLKRFEREVQLTSALTHPNTIAIYDYGHTLDGVFYYAMELLDGLTLSQLVARDGPQPVGRVLHILSQAARALAEAHAVGLVHRDVKPANIFLCVRGGVHDFVKVLDFGLVKEVHSPDASLSAPNVIAGTPLYMAPETIKSPGDVDARVDIYALGAVGYCLIAGEPPFTGESAVEVYHGHLYEQPAPLSERLGKSVPHEVEAILMRCLSKAPTDRPGSATELAETLDTLQASPPWTEKDASDWWRSRGLSRSSKGEKQSVIGDANLTDGLGATEMLNLPVTVRERPSS